MTQICVWIDELARSFLLARDVTRTFLSLHQMHARRPCSEHFDRVWEAFVVGYFYLHRSRAMRENSWCSHFDCLRERGTASFMAKVCENFWFLLLILWSFAGCLACLLLKQKVFWRRDECWRWTCSDCWQQIFSMFKIAIRWRRTLITMASQRLQYARSIFTQRWGEIRR